jgi:DNA (cytosine-5)-methyltransferase 3A
MNQKGINVLSLFDGMSCGQQALERQGIVVDNYFASEIDKHAIAVTMHNYPNTKQLGSVVYVNGNDLPKIDLLIGGSPCQSFSFAGKRKGMSTKCETEILTLQHYLELKAEGYEFEGQSYLFWEFMRLLNEVKPKYFLLENVEMGEKWERVLSKAIGVNGLHINSALVSAQNRKRIYWTNIGMQPGGLFGDIVSIIQQPKDKGILLKDILEIKIADKYFLSEKILNGFLLHKEKQNEKGNGFNFNPRNENQKATCLIKTIDSPTNNYIVHNTMPRSSTTGKGGTGPLSRTDGKTYCLDTGNTNAVEIQMLNDNQKKKFDLNPNTDKASCLTLAQGRAGSSDEYMDSVSKIAKIQGKIRRLTPVECERLQTVKDNYTAVVSDTQRYRMLGNGWTVDVIAHIFSYAQFL